MYGRFVSLQYIFLDCLTDASVFSLDLFLLYFYFFAIIEEEVEIMGTKKAEAKNNDRVNQK